MPRGTYSSSLSANSSPRWGMPLRDARVRPATGTPMGSKFMFASPHAIWARFRPALSRRRGSSGDIGILPACWVPLFLITGPSRRATALAFGQTCPMRKFPRAVVIGLGHARRPSVIRTFARRLSGAICRRSSLEAARDRPPRALAQPGGVENVERSVGRAWSAETIGARSPQVDSRV